MTLHDAIGRARVEEYLTVQELAAIVRYAPQTMWRKIRRGEIPGVERHGRSIRIHKARALRWAASTRHVE
ncbi:helix-turn-helix domain-containing protein [Luteitalea sp.]